MILAYLTHDEVNQDLARRLADAAGVRLCPLFIKDAGAGPFDAVLHDLDSLPSADRQLILKALLAAPLTCAAAVHGYNLEEAEVEALRARGVAVHRRLDEEVFAGLARAAGRVHGLTDDTPTLDIDLGSLGFAEPAADSVG